MHLRYHTHKSGKLSNSHGLQLHHWATEIGLKLRIHVYGFNEDLADYMEVIEKKFAIALSLIKTNTHITSLRLRSHKWSIII